MLFKRKIQAKNAVSVFNIDIFLPDHRILICLCMHSKLMKKTQRKPKGETQLKQRIENKM